MSKPTKKSAKAAPAAKASSSKGNASSVVPFALMGDTASTKSFESMEKIMSNSKNQYEKISADATNASRQGVEAITKSCNILAKGTEQMMKTCMQIAQQSAERNGEAFKTLLACKTLNELTEVQNRIAQENFDEAMTATTKLSEMAIKISTDVFEPINDQMSQSIKKATESMAA